MIISAFNMTLRFIAAGCVVAAMAARAGESTGPNVLFIAVDDLRPDLGCYGESRIKSPHIDRLASQGLVFDRAYCQQAICMSSRASLLSGYRPDKGRIYQNGPLFKHLPDALTLNQHFLNHGYETVVMGKIYHHSGDYSRGWSRPPINPKGEWIGRGYLDPNSQRIAREFDEAHPDSERKGLGPAFEAPDVPDDAYPDGLLAAHAVNELRRLKDRRFFLAIGFAKPHLPFNAPKKYWDLYQPADIRLADNPLEPRNMPREAGTNWGELRSYHGIPEKGPVPDDLARKLVHGYQACISYTDAMIGRVLDELDRLGLSDHTVVVLWGDHGWKLGEHGMWCKHTNFELDTRAPLIIRAPGMKARGNHTKALTEFVDIYPTLCDLCGLDLPKHLEGTSATPLLNNPDQPWKKAAFSQYPHGKLMGYSMRTGRYRYTEWRELKTKAVKSRALYDHQLDPGENTNIAGNPENADLVTSLAKQLSDGYQAAKP